MSCSCYLTPFSSDASGSGEINFGWSDNNDINDIKNATVTTGGSSNKILEIGYEVSVGRDVAPMHNISFGLVGSVSPVPIETHMYYTKTSVNEWFRY